MAQQFVVVKLMGRLGNQFYQLATAVAYAKRHGFQYFATSTAENCDANAYYFKNFPQRDMGGSIYQEKIDDKGYAYYAEIPNMPNCFLIGYWQSFQYFDDHRQDIIEAFNLPYEMKKDYVSIHVRRGDYLQLSEKLNILPLEYYRNAVNQFKSEQKYKFKVFSDDIEWCKEHFNQSFGVFFEFSEGKTELEDFIEMSCCEHNILANSTFSFAASWLNQNENKIICTPDEDNMFGGHNTQMIPDTYTKIKF